MKELSYPFDSAYLLKNRRKIKRQLLEDGTVRIRKKIAVLGGSTTNDIVSMLEIFLMEQGIECEFYLSEYAKYWEDVMFANEELLQFKPDLIYIHTTARNITEYDLNMKASRAECGNALNRQFEHFKSMWERIEEIYSCPIIQNNFEMPIYRILGNRDAWDYHGHVNFISRLNIMFYDYAVNHENFYINDINYLSACCGLDKWSEPSYWYMYKYAVNPQFIPDLAFNISNIIKSIFGKNKKALALDLDNTLWGGVIGDDGVDGIEIGHETATAEAFYAFQKYVKEQQKIGVLLGVCSKNDYENALKRLKEALVEDESEIVIDGVLHRYEFTFELAWKCMKDYLEYLGLENKTGSPREVIQLSYKQNIIEDGELWIEMMLSRNSLSHLYDEGTSKEIYNDIKERFVKEFEKLENKFNEVNIEL